MGLDELERGKGFLGDGDEGGGVRGGEGGQHHQAHAPGGQDLRCHIRSGVYLSSSRFRSRSMLLPGLCQAQFSELKKAT